MTSTSRIQQLAVGNSIVTALDANNDGVVDAYRIDAYRNDGSRNAAASTTWISAKSESEFNQMLNVLSQTTGLSIVDLGTASSPDEALYHMDSGTVAELHNIASALTTSFTTGSVSAEVQGRWANFISQVKVDGGVDVNSLVQAVLREAYIENTKDLHFYAQKVQFFNELKKKIRDEITYAREVLAQNAAQANDAALVGGALETLHFPAEPVFDQAGNLVPHPPVAGDPPYVTTKAELDAYIKKLEERLNSVGDDAQLANVDLQNMLQKQQQTLQMMSNISKMLHDTAMAVIRKIGG